MHSISDNLKLVRERINSAAKKCGRDPLTIKLIAVGKNHPASAIKEAYAAGQTVFGENYAQDFRDKSVELSGLDIEWHFIGHLQRNKVKYIADNVSYIHSIDSAKLAEEINRRAVRPIDILIEVNLAGEESKSGCSPKDVAPLVNEIGGLSNLRLRGLMTIPPYNDDPEKSRPYFKKLEQLLMSINEQNIYSKRLTELSMGMTQDLEIAIEEGSTMVRVGTAIFGERTVS